MEGDVPKGFVFWKLCPPSAGFSPGSAQPNNNNNDEDELEVGPSPSLLTCVVGVLCSVAYCRPLRCPHRTGPSRLAPARPGPTGTVGPHSIVRRGLAHYIGGKGAQITSKQSSSSSCLRWWRRWSHLWLWLRHGGCSEQIVQLLQSRVFVPCRG